MKYIFNILLVLFVFGYFSCQKPDDYYSQSDVMLEFSVDTVMFDTVFTTFGTTTKRFKVYNPYAQPVKVASIQLAKGTNSAYRLNIDGVPGRFFHDLEINARDSIFIFVEATIDPLDVNSPLIVQDSLVFNTNGNNQDVDLIAWGQDVHLFNDEYITDSYWPADKPYLIYNYAVVDTLNTLTIAPGAKVYFHKSSKMLVFGTLIAEGSMEEPIVFKSDRLEEFYDNIPNQWDGIYLLGKNNRMNWVEISQSLVGVVLQQVHEEVPALKIHNTKIQHIYMDGLIAINAHVSGSNVLIANCGQSCFSLIQNGSCEFYHSTFANYYGGIRNHPIVALQNYGVEEGYIIPGNISRAFFGNCIVYGNNENEIFLNNSVDGVIVDGEFKFTFDHCIIKTKEETITGWSENFINFIRENPKFKDYSNYDYHLDTLSPAQDKGNIQWGQLHPIDLDQVNRISDGKPDIGAYERIETTEK